MMRLAIVDDNETWCFVLAHFLEQRGFEVKIFGDPSQFLRVAPQFDLALVDFCIAPKRYQIDMNGAELICKVKEQYEIPPLLVLVSSFFTDDTLEAAEAACPGADAYFSKNLGLKILEEEVRRLIAARHQTSQAAPEVVSRELVGSQRDS